MNSNGGCLKLYTWYSQDQHLWQSEDTRPEQIVNDGREDLNLEFESFGAQRRAQFGEEKAYQLQQTFREDRASSAEIYQGVLK